LVLEDENPELSKAIPTATISTGFSGLKRPYAACPRV
jgi:hypothetical protein